MKRASIAVVIASILWFVMFSPLTKGFYNFWSVMSFSAVILTALGFAFGNGWKGRFRVNVKDVFTGIASAAVLYGVFYVGNELSGRLFDFSGAQVDSVYALKEGQNPVILLPVLLFLVGPAEEIFWRGYIQRTLAGKWGRVAAVAVTTLLYASVHIWSFNFMLIMAALVCGIFWGTLYALNKSLPAVLISHALWDAAVFILFPFS